jgi:hypothetical protein
MRLLTPSNSSLLLARFAETPSLWRVSRIFRRNEMPILAMGGGSLVGDSYFNCLFDSSCERVSRFLRGIFVAHTLFRPSNDGIRLKFMLSGKLRESVVFSFKSYKDALFLIPLLFNWSRPSAIRRLVVTVIVNPVKRSASRPLSHVLNKIPKIFPSLTNSDASSSVPFPAAYPRISASIDHPRPNFVKRMCSLFHDNLRLMDSYARHYTKCQEIAMGGQVAA